MAAAKMIGRGPLYAPHIPRILMRTSSNPCVRRFHHGTTLDLDFCAQMRMRLCWTLGLESTEPPEPPPPEVAFPMLGLKRFGVVPADHPLTRTLMVTQIKAFFMLNIGRGSIARKSFLVCPSFLNPADITHHEPSLFNLAVSVCHQHLSIMKPFALLALVLPATVSAAAVVSCPATRPNAPYQRCAKVDTNRCAVVGRMSVGQLATVACYTYGDQIGNSAMWFKVTVNREKGYISDYYMANCYGMKPCCSAFSPGQQPIDCVSG
ncbi:hypothetical protein K402DRAFT_148619 [Aulographum hederae CBS 113979]|uniref:Uncharacterized protein n=1 Tax=Aulographum hederae CBS 113979 TaxID=1176131 RepID=A0A6G1GU64_9PEZI|nr:hypothetical protein K402DRAFT_148619 [Aulographum hederae CBS 113979]